MSTQPAAPRRTTDLTAPVVALSGATGRVVRIGLGIDPAHLRMVGVDRAGAVCWAMHGALEPGELLADALAELLAGVPRPRLAWRRPTVTAALDSTLAQLRHIAGLPDTRDAALLGGIVAEGAGRFFLRRAAASVTTGVAVTGNGAGWAAALDASACEAVQRACRSARFQLRAVVPALAVVPLATRDGVAEWGDGDARAIVTLDAGRLASLRRAAPDERVPAPVLSDGLARAGDAWCLADAYGAAVQPDAAALMWRPGHGPALPGASEDGAMIPRWRMAVAAGVCAVAVVAALVAPTLRAQHVAQEARARLARLAPVRGEAVRASRELTRVTDALARVASFDAGRHSPTAFLAALTTRLPDGAALLQVRVDSIGGTLIALAPRATGVLAALERVSGVAGPEVVGPVTREAVAIAGAPLPAPGTPAPTREVERVTVRFRFVAPSSARVATARTVAKPATVAGATR